MIRTQVALTGPLTKVFWINAPEHNLKTGQEIELIELSGKWIITAIYVALPEQALEGLPHRKATIKE